MNLCEIHSAEIEGFENTGILLVFMNHCSGQQRKKVSCFSNSKWSVVFKSYKQSFRTEARQTISSYVWVELAVKEFNFPRRCLPLCLSQIACIFPAGLHTSKMSNKFFGSIKSRRYSLKCNIILLATARPRAVHNSKIKKTTIFSYSQMFIFYAGLRNRKIWRRFRFWHSIWLRFRLRFKLRFLVLYMHIHTHIRILIRMCTYS